MQTAAAGLTATQTDQGRPPSAGTPTGLPPSASRRTPKTASGTETDTDSGLEATGKTTKPGKDTDTSADTGSHSSGATPLLPRNRARSPNAGMPGGPRSRQATHGGPNPTTGGRTPRQLKWQQARGRRPTPPSLGSRPAGRLGHNGVQSTRADALPTTPPRTKETRTPCPWTSLQPKPLVKTQGNPNKKLQTSTTVERTQDHIRKMEGSHQTPRAPPAQLPPQDGPRNNGRNGNKTVNHARTSSATSSEARNVIKRWTLR